MWLVTDIVWLDENVPALLPFDENRLNEYLDLLFAAIAACDDIHGADRFLDELGEFQTNLAKALFKYKAALPYRCQELVPRPFHKYSG